ANKRPKSKKGKKESKSSTSQTRRPTGKKELEMTQEVVLSDSDGTDEDWREFLMTHKSHESHPNTSSSDEGDGTIMVEPKMRVLKPSPDVGSRPKPKR
ncbi:hypothetical protein A2U01_0071370, partial [Trifolium medium]|nr:hypothetical protein [Trifolium medium]